MRTLRTLTGPGLWVAISCLAASVPPLRAPAAEVSGSPASGEVDYVTQVKPILLARCYSCHGALKQKAELRLDTAALAAKGGKAGPAVVAGKAGESRLIHALTGTNGAEQMPAEGEPLKPAEVDLIRRWIDQGAKAPTDELPQADPQKHWAYQPPVRPAVPQVKNVGWVRNPIDAFLAAEHEKRGLAPRPEADKHVLLRRVFLDLTGLPPTREQLHAFLNNPAPDAYEKVVDDLLATTAYGERWGRHWMDVWRYSDWAGFQAEVRDSQPHVWRWRDWIIESLNADKPYDRMVTEMLAGDELAPTDPQTIRATGFLARSWYKFNRNVWLENAVEHTSKAFLATTVNCAKCHDHMYDPVSQKEHYQFRAFFEPYTIRTDPVPGQIDPAKDGLARVFDEKADAKTFLFIRGDEKQPVESDPLPPAVPAALGGSLKIEPVSLPPQAYYPGLQPFVQQTAVTAATAAVQQAEAALAQAKAAVPEAEKQLALAHDAREKEQSLAASNGPAPHVSAPTDTTKPFLEDTFAAALSDVWKPGLGQWEYRDGKLHQLQTGAEFRPLVSLADHPQNFTASFKFKITGGQQWCSVGMSFDVTDAGDENCVYLSAHAGGPSCSLFYKQGNSPVYPPGNALPMPIKLGEEYVLRVDARDQLVNVYVNGAYVRAYRFPRTRQAGKFAVWAFDASAEFLSVRVAELPAGAELKEPTPDGATPQPAAPPPTAADPVATANAALDKVQQEAAAAELRLNIAKADAAFAQARVAADNAKYATPPPPEAERNALAVAARTAELALLVLRAEEAARKAEQELATARAAVNPADANTANAVKTAEQKVTEAQKALAAAQDNAKKPSADYSPLTPVYPTASTGRRLALARWITSRDNPLTARVAINHIWMRHFNEPLVPTVFDFGLNGKPPTHPALLDWLAVELMDKGWSQKAIHRLIVTSAAYRMRSDPAGLDDPNRKLDPDNVYLWRMNARRMEAEVVRDSVLHVAGSLDPAFGGPDLDHAQGLAVGRRSLYFRHAHEKQMTFLKLFDAASPSECYRRDQSVMPQQALALANSPLGLANARKLAATITARVGDQPTAPAITAFVTEAFEQLLSRPPTADERAACEAFLTKQTATLSDPSKLSPFTSGDPSPVPPSANPHQRARENLVHVLLNHNDFVTIR